MYSTIVVQNFIVVFTACCTYIYIYNFVLIDCLHAKNSRGYSVGDELSDIIFLVKVKLFFSLLLVL